MELNKKRLSLIWKGLLRENIDTYTKIQKQLFKLSLSSNSKKEKENTANYIAILEKNFKNNEEEMRKIEILVKTIEWK